MEYRGIMETVRLYNANLEVASKELVGVVTHSNCYSYKKILELTAINKTKVELSNNE